MKSRWHWELPVLALVFQGLAPALLWALPVLFYHDPPYLSEAVEWPVSLILIASFAILSLLLASIGAYGLLTRSSRRTAVALIVVCCVPAWIGGAVYLHALLVFLTLA
ncbi:MAG TPA: hypothetical protein PLO37_14740 [Candidatus Hydrogenedentes bacterium]|nr:hypothetical protein [Candidatus Hydrogenedentota bacterium]HPG68103.1 hypothetical protein [Candidatus Hydrogenedentota bacterium]